MDKISGVYKINVVLYILTFGLLYKYFFNPDSYYDLESQITNVLETFAIVSFILLVIFSMLHYVTFLISLIKGRTQNIKDTELSKDWSDSSFFYFTGSFSIMSVITFAISVILMTIIVLYFGILR
jgi:hypothetical protein